jgi:hypothetical protein
MLQMIVSSRQMEKCLWRCGVEKVFVRVVVLYSKYIRDGQECVKKVDQRQCCTMSIFCLIFFSHRICAEYIVTG